MRDAIVSGNGRVPRPASPGATGSAGHGGTFGADDLPALRRLAAEHGRQAGLNATRLGDFVLAVNEVATNAVSHGGASAQIRLWSSRGEACCEVRGGAWTSAQPPPGVPDDTDSLRLWVVWQVCSEVRLSYGPGEPAVFLAMRAR
jgi:serine/threonine-protein kinase RsbW